MLREWVREQWEEVKYAHKSVWTSMAFFILLTGYTVWYVQEYSYSGQLKEKDATIAVLSSQIRQLQQELAKGKPKSANTITPRNGDSSMIDDVKENAQEELNTMSNNINNGVNDTINDVKSETQNAASNIHNDLHQTYRKSSNKLNNQIDGMR